MNHSRRAVTLLLALALLVAQSAAPLASVVAAPQGEDDTAKFARLIGASGYTATRMNESAWFIRQEGKAFQRSPILLGVSEGMVIVGVVLAKKDEMPETAAFYRKLLDLNHTISRAKVGLDNDSDAFVRVELSLRVMDAEELQANIRDVIKSTQEAYAQIEGDLRAQP